MLRANDDDPGFILSSPDETSQELCAEELNNVVDTEWTPDGRTIVISANSENSTDLWFFDMESRQATKKLTNLANLDYPPCAWSPDCSQAVVITADSSGRGFALIERYGDGVRPLASYGDESGILIPGRPSWSPDGEYIAIPTLVSGNPADCRIQIFDNEGSWKADLHWPEQEFTGIYDIAWFRGDG